MSDKYSNTKIVDKELLNKVRGASPVYMGDLLELVERLGGHHQLQRRHTKSPLDLNLLKKQIESDLRADPNGNSEIHYLKSILIILIDEINTLKGV